MRRGGYIGAIAGEFLLLLLSTWALSVVGFNGFFLDSIVEGSGWAFRAGLALVVSAVLLVILYAAASKRSRWVGLGVVYVLVAAAIVVVALFTSTGENPYVDEEGNYLYLALVLVVSNTAGFLLTRTLTGCAIWFLACAFLCAIIQALYEPDELVMSIVATLASLALIVLCNFRLGIVGADVARRSSRAGSFLTSVLSVVAAGALALLVWFAVISPLDPGVVNIKLFTDYRQLPTEEFKGVADEQPTLNYDLTSDNLVEGFYYTTDDLVEDPESLKIIDAYSMLEQLAQEQGEEGQQSESQSSGGGQEDSLDENSQEEEYNVVSYSEILPWIILGIILTILIIAAIVAFFLLRRRHRRQRLARMLSQPPRAQVESIYLFLLGRLKRLGFSVPDGSTLSEWSASQARAMDMLSEETRVGFDELTHTYYNCSYGHAEPKRDDIVPFVAYYVRFWKAARTHLGNFRYFFKSFRL